MYTLYIFGVGNRLKLLSNSQNKMCGKRKCYESKELNN